MWSYWTDPKEDDNINWSGYYSKIMATAHSIRFHSRFTANSYFVAPQGSENILHHTEPPEVLGLAIALSASNPAGKASLFLPRTKPLDWIALDQLAKAHGVAISSVFGPDKLSLQKSCGDGMCITINGSASNNDKIATQFSPMDLPQLSSENLSLLNPNSARVNNLLSNKQTSPLPFTKTSEGIEEQLFFITAELPTRKQKLYVELDFAVFPKQPVRDQKGPYPPPFKVTTHKPRFGHKVIDMPGDGALGWQFAIFGPNSSGQGTIPYRAVCTKVPAGGYKLRFEYPEGSGRYFGFYLNPKQDGDRKSKRDSAAKPNISVLNTADSAAVNLKELVVSFEPHKMRKKIPTLPSSDQPLSLGQFVGRSASAPPSELDTSAFNLASSLGFLLKRSEESTLALLCVRLPTAFINTGFIWNAMIDKNLSSVVPYVTVLGTLFASRGDLICTRAPTAPDIELAPGLRIQTQAVKFSVENIRTAKCSVLATTSAVLVSDDGKLWPLSASTSFSLDADTQEVPSWSLRFTDARPSPEQVISQLKPPSLTNKDSDIMKEVPPFCKDSLHAILSREGVEDIEFEYKQNNYALPESTLASVSFGVKSDDWRGALPDMFLVKDPKAVNSAAIKIKLRNPASQELARLGVIIDFNGTIECKQPIGAKQYELLCTLSATPLAGQGDYECRLSCRLTENTSNIPTNAVDARTLLESVGLAMEWEKVKNSIPMANDKFVRGVIQAISIRLVKTPPKYSLGNFELDFDFDLLPLVTGSDLYLWPSTAKMHLQTLYGVVKCEGTGIVWVRDRPMFAQVRLPQISMPGKQEPHSPPLHNLIPLSGFITLKLSGPTFSRLIAIPYLAAIPLFQSTSSDPQIKTMQFQLSNSTNNNEG